MSFPRETLTNRLCCVVLLGITIRILVPDLLTGLPADLSAQEIVHRSVEQNEKDWKQAPKYGFTERDIVSKKGNVKRRTFKVLMIDGSPYNQLVAENGRPLSQDRIAEEQIKVNEETARRLGESASERRHRVVAYQRSRQQEHTLMREMVNAFDFKLVGRERINGRDCYVLDASPRRGYQPTTYETKVLTGMRGRMWIDTQEYEWVKVEARVFQPVSLAGFIAHVEPGTEFVLEKSPVGGGVWLPSHFVKKVHANAFVLWSKNFTEDETYSDYRRNPEIGG